MGRDIQAGMAWVGKPSPYKKVWCAEVWWETTQKKPCLMSKVWGKVGKGGERKSAKVCARHQTHMVVLLLSLGGVRERGGSANQRMIESF